jgi:hypothetical protein
VRLQADLTVTIDTLGVHVWMGSGFCLLSVAVIVRCPRLAAATTGIHSWFTKQTCTDTAAAAGCAALTALQIRLIAPARWGLPGAHAVCCQFDGAPLNVQQSEAQRRVITTGRCPPVGTGWRHTVRAFRGAIRGDVACCWFWFAPLLRVVGIASLLRVIAAFVPLTALSLLQSSVCLPAPGWGLVRGPLQGACATLDDAASWGCDTDITSKYVPAGLQIDAVGLLLLYACSCSSAAAQP